MFHKGRRLVADGLGLASSFLDVWLRLLLSEVSQARVTQIRGGVGGSGGGGGGAVLEVSAHCTSNSDFKTSKHLQASRFLCPVCSTRTLWLEH